MGYNGGGGDVGGVRDMVLPLRVSFRSGSFVRVDDDGGGVMHYGLSVGCENLVGESEIIIADGIDTIIMFFFSLSVAYTRV